jgi:hypothetical protein
MLLFLFLYQIIYRGCRMGRVGVGVAPLNGGCYAGAPAGDYLKRAGGDALIVNQFKCSKKKVDIHYPGRANMLVAQSCQKIIYYCIMLGPLKTYNCLFSAHKGSW